MAAWTAAYLARLVLRALQKLLVRFLVGPASWLAIALCLLAAGAVLAALAIRFLRPVFLTYLPRLPGDRLLFCFPLFLLLLLLSYFCSSAASPTLLVLLLLLALGCFLVLLRAVSSQAVIARLQEEAREAARQLAAEREEFARVRGKVEAGRSYRHDMRHHLQVLSGLAEQGDAEGVAAYVGGLSERLNAAEYRPVCENPALNALLSASLRRANDLGCAVAADILLPNDLPFEEHDLAAVLGNALENALNACRALPKERRALRVAAKFQGDAKLTVAVDNPCPQPVEFDAQGFPLAPAREGHGLGLKNAAAAVKKYHGVFQCSCQNGEFHFRAVLFAPGGSPSAPRRPSSAAARAVPVILGCMAAFCLAVNCLPQTAQALSSLPVVGTLVRLADLRSYRFGWGGTSLNAQVPVFEGSPSPSASPQSSPAPQNSPAATGPDAVGPGPASGADALNARLEEELAALTEEFLWYAQRRYAGYVSAETSYAILRDDARLLVVRFDATLNVGGSVEYSRPLVYDRQAGRVLTLSGLFAPGSDYVGALSAEVLRQMTAAVEAGTGDYFVAGGIWLEEDCFTAIDPDQAFFIDESGQLVLQFEEYEVAPGSMGAPAFVIPASVYEGLLAPDSPLLAAVGRR